MWYSINLLVLFISELLWYVQQPTLKKIARFSHSSVLDKTKFIFIAIHWTFHFERVSLLSIWFDSEMHHIMGIKMGSHSYFMLIFKALVKYGSIKKVHHKIHKESFL